MNNDDLESFLLLLIKLLAACHLLYQFLDDHLVVVIRFTWRNLDVIVATENDALNGGMATRTCLEFLQLTLDLMHGIGSVELLEQAFGEGALTRTRRAI